MRKTKLALALGDVEYGKRIVSCLMNHYRDSVEIHAFGQELDLLEMLMKKESDTIETTYDILVCCDQDEETLRKIPWGKLSQKMPILYLLEDVQDLNENKLERSILSEEVVTWTEKYQEVRSLMNEIEKRVAKDVTAIYNGGELKPEMPMLGVYSLADNQYQLPFALTLGAILSDQRRVLLLDLQENSGISQLISGEETMGLEDLILASQEKEIGRERMLACIGHLDKMDLVYPAANSEVISEVGAKEYLKLLELLRTELSYEQIIINFGSRFQGFFELLNRMEQLYLLEGKGGLCQWREYEFRQELKDRGYDGLLQRVQKVQLPITTFSNSCERIVEQWKWNELGDMIRKMGSVGDRVGIS